MPLMARQTEIVNCYLLGENPDWSGDRRLFRAVGGFYASYTRTRALRKAMMLTIAIDLANIQVFFIFEKNIQRDEKQIYLKVNHTRFHCFPRLVLQRFLRPGRLRSPMRPPARRRLGSIDAEYPSAAGLIKSSWKFEGDKWIWKFTVPEGAEALVTLPGESEPKGYGAGTYTLEQTI